MTISLRERAAVALVGIVLFGFGLAWRSMGASARVDQPAPVRLDTTAQGAAESVTDVVRIESLQGPIFDPFRAVVKDQTDPGRPGSTTLAANAQPANPMGFATDRVPRMLDPNPGVYALGTGSAMMSPGGPLLHVNDMWGTLRIVAIDGSGVYLSNGSVLRERSVTRGTTTEQKASAPESAPSPMVLQLPPEGATQVVPGSPPAPAPAATTDPSRADLIMRRFLNSSTSTTAPGAH